MSFKNVEEFLVEFKFADKDVVKGIKGFLREYKKFNKDVVEGSKKERSARKAVNSEIKEGNSLLTAQNTLRRKIQQAEKSGVNADFYRRSLASAKKIETVRRRTAELDRKLLISKGSDNSAEIAKQAKNRKRLEEAAHQEDISRSGEARRKLAQDRKINSFKNSSQFRTTLKHDPDTAKASLKGFSRAIRRGDVIVADNYKASLRGVARELTKVQAKTRSLNIAQKGLNDSTRNMIRSYASIFAVFQGVSSISSIGQNFQTLDAAMLLSSGNSKQAANDMAFVNSEAKRLGLNLSDATDGFLKFQFAAKGKISKGDTRGLFTGFSEFATALGVDKFRFEKGLQALQQMMNKGQIMSEELKQQLAEQIPGSMKAFERALGVGTAELFKMMEAGELMSADVLPKVGREMAKMAREGGALDAMLKNVKVTQGQLVIGLQEGADTIFKGGFSQGLSDLFKGLLVNIQESQEGLVGLGKVFGLIFKSIKIAANILIPMLDSLAFVTGSFITLLGESSLAQAVVGIGTVTAAFIFLKPVLFGINLLLKGMVTKLLLIPALIVGVVDEIFSLFDPNRTGLVEHLLFGGKQMQDMVRSQDLGLAKWINPFFGLVDTITRSSLSTEAANTTVKAGDVNVKVDIDGVAAAIDQKVGSEYFAGVVSGI